MISTAGDREQPVHMNEGNHTERNVGAGNRVQPVNSRASFIDGGRLRTKSWETPHIRVHKADLIGQGGSFDRI